MSLWSQSARVHCETVGVVTVLVRASLADQIEVEQVHSVSGVLVADTTVQMSGDKEGFHENGIHIHKKLFYL